MEHEPSSTSSSTIDAAAEEPQYLLALPEHILLHILQQLDVVGLCSVAQTCTQLLRVASAPQLWPGPHCEDCVSVAARMCLAAVLHLPPQVLQVAVDIKRSRRFPISASLHYLRPILGTNDVEGLADTTSKLLQERACTISKRLPTSACTWRCWPPLAAVSICRSDRASVRMAVRPAAVVPRLLSDMEALGWPLLQATCPVTGQGPQPMQSTTADAVMDALQAGQQVFSAGIMQASWLGGGCSSHQAREPKDRLAALRPLAGIATWASKVLPLPSTAREHALPQFGTRPPVERGCLADMAVRVMYGAAQAPGIAVSVCGKPGWTRLLEHCCMLVRQHRRVEEFITVIAQKSLPTAEGCMPVQSLAHMLAQASLSPAFDAAWPTATAADALLLLQLAGFKGAVSRAAASGHGGELFTFAETACCALDDWRGHSSSKGHIVSTMLAAAGKDAEEASEEVNCIEQALSECKQLIRVAPDLCSHEVIEQLDDRRHALVRLRVYLEACRVLQWCIGMLGGVPLGGY